MRILLTGASGGIGQATARALAAPDRELGLHSHRHPGAARALGHEVERRSRSVHLWSADLGSLAGTRALAEQVASTWDSLDLLVHNAGDYPRQAFADITPETFEACLRTNLLGPAELTRLLLPLLDRAPRPRLVFVSSVLAFTGSTHGAHYASAKAGLLGLARSLARELAPRYRVNVVAPGPIDTAILAGDSPERRRAREAEIPLRRIGTPEEIAGAIAFLAGPGSDYLTGTVIHANGGTYLG